MTKYTEESIEKVIEFLEANPLIMGLHLDRKILDKTARREIIEKYLLPNIFNFIKTPMQEEIFIFKNARVKEGALWIECKKCIKDILVEKGEV